ncbi:hypothetical protein N780_05790 [Pontibacillus chungwhensis BH030062]|uniref:DUF4181 domain-containing protein n=1 Tax=Pontibacillus chungwhensis BH030062 TaxID=1385513 RepID=A0A0A2V944_9BACI|nr:DUF4181 domain-containing protein [Pontibacillus chungwhensis]KGP90225.1 hypothetical protein N780_05790 [Pontibacillus chungwhensis BH030062]
MNVIVLLLVFSILLFMVEKITTKILKVEKIMISETSGKKIDRFGRGVILLIFVSTLWFVVKNDSILITKLYFMTYLTFLLGFQAVMEFFFIKGSKQYISTVVVLVVSLILFYNFNEFLHG